MTTKTREIVLGALARGYCYAPNTSKEMDSELCLTMAGEIEKVIPDLVAEQQQMACIWTKDRWDECHETSCGQAFSLTEGTLAECDFKFCTYCGKKIEEVIPEDEVSDDQTS